MMTFEVKAHWDAEARVWWAESTDVPGLVAEADTMEALVATLREIVPEMLRLNTVFREARFQFNVVADRVEGVPAVA